MAKVLRHVDQIVPLNKMEDGDVAEIITWHNGDREVGDLIQRFANSVLVIGQPSGEAYTTLFGAGPGETNKVRILQRGTTIVL